MAKECPTLHQARSTSIPEKRPGTFWVPPANYLRTFTHQFIARAPLAHKRLLRALPQVPSAGPQHIGPDAEFGGEPNSWDAHR